MTNSEVIELDGQYDLALAGNPAAPGDDPAATQQLCLVGLMGAVDRATPSNPGTEAAPLRRSPDFRRLKEALRSQPPELTAQLREPADQPADNLRTRLWQRLRSQTAMLRWQVVALVCGLSLALSLIAFSPISMRHWRCAPRRRKTHPCARPANLGVRPTPLPHRA